MIIDIITIILLVGFFVRGYKRGFIVAIFSFLGIVAGIIGALKLSHTLADYLLVNDYVRSGWAQFISYIILFVAVLWLAKLLAKSVESLAESIQLGWANKALGGTFYAAVVAIALSALLWLCREMQLLPTETIATSKSYMYIEPIAPWVAEQLGTFWPMAKTVFADLKGFFDTVNEILKENVGTAG